MRISYTLVTDGSRDQYLLPKIIRWTIRNIDRRDLQLKCQPGTFSGERGPNLAERLRLALREYPCDILFVHRDAEAQNPSMREREIRDAIEEACIHEPSVPIIPVRMTEAWLLISESAIRKAADNPNGKLPLDMPNATELESLSNPKERLHRMLEVASEKRGRKLRQFQRDINRRVHRVGEYIDDYSLLLKLPAFKRFDEQTRSAIANVLACKSDPS